MDMPLHDNTIKKIFREQFKGEMPLIKFGAEKNALISNIKQKLSAMAGFTLLKTSSYRHYRKNEAVCCFQIRSSSKYYRDQEFCLKFNEQHELIIEEGYWRNSPVYHLDQIYTLGEKMKVEYKRLEANYLKREKNKLKKQKIKELKHKAIVAKIIEFAKADKFEFSVEESATKVKLLVRLAESEILAIDIPYEQFQDTLKNLQVTIKTVRKLRDSGTPFQVFSYPRGYWEPEWISYN
jgi:hypothetical protein